MDKYTFFKPTSLYKEFIILDLIEKNKNITQREISDFIGSAVSMINHYIDDYESKGLIYIKRHSTKTVDYFVTKKGIERKKLLNIAYLNDSLKVFKSASVDIVKFLNQIVEKGFRRIFLYGAGEVAEILLRTLKADNNISIDIIGLIDDDEIKQNTTLVGVKILPMESIFKTDFDGILISSYSNKSVIMNKLLNRNLKKENILNFFEN